MAMSSRKVPLLCDDNETIGDAGCTRAFCFVVVGIFGGLSIRGVVCPALTLMSRAKRGVSKGEGGPCGAACARGPSFEMRRCACPGRTVAWPLLCSAILNSSVVRVEPV
jgi:hypothetical protein